MSCDGSGNKNEEAEMTATLKSGECLVIETDETGFNTPPRITGKRSIRVQGGRYEVPFFQAERGTNASGDEIYKNALNYGSVRDMSFWNVDSPGAVFDQGFNGALFSGLSFWYCTSPAFNFHSRDETKTSGSNTMNHLQSCHFRLFKGTPLLMNWPQVLDSCFFEDGEARAIDGRCGLTSVTTIRNSTFERCGPPKDTTNLNDKTSVIHWEKGTLRLVDCRLGFCPNPSYYFTLGVDARLILVNTAQTLNPNPRNPVLCDRPENMVIVNEAGYVPAK